MIPSASLQSRCNEFISSYADDLDVPVEHLSTMDLQILAMAIRLNNEGDVEDLDHDLDVANAIDLLSELSPADIDYLVVVAENYPTSTTG